MTMKERLDSLVIRITTEIKTVKSKISGNTSGDLSGLTTTVKTSILAAINELVTSINGKQANLGYTAENVANKGAANGYASLDGTGKVPAAQLPGFVDDILEGTYVNATTFNNLSSVAYVLTAGVIYVDTTTNLQWRWSGTALVGMNSALALGETSATAYRGDRGKQAYDHATLNDGSNPHGTTFANLGGKPTTLAGFGITDAYTKTEMGVIDTDWVALFEANL